MIGTATLAAGLAGAALAALVSALIFRHRFASQSLAVVDAERRFQSTFDSTVEAMAVVDAYGIVHSVNASVERVFGYPAAELLGRNISLLMPEAVGAQHDHYLRRYRETGEKAIIGVGREVTGRRRDGSEFPLDLSVAEWKRGDDSFFTGIMRDISARKNAESALRASEENLRLLQNEFAHLSRVNDLGEMAAAIAHEINQPLTAIVNYLNTGLFLARTGYSEDAFAEAELMMVSASEQTLRAGDIVRRLRDFVGQGNAVRTVERVEHLIDSAMALALIDARLIGIVVDRFVDAGEAEVEVDAVQIQQVIANLLRNAVEAMASVPRPGVARLSVSTALTPDGMIEFSVADTGPGIAPELEGRLFDPFVTTKSQGMGMGLSVCRRLIDAHGGTIEAAKNEAGGATFRFRLPCFGSNTGKVPDC